MRTFRRSRTRQADRHHFTRPPATAASRLGSRSLSAPYSPPIRWPRRYSEEHRTGRHRERPHVGRQEPERREAAEERERVGEFVFLTFFHTSRVLRSDANAFGSSPSRRRGGPEEATAESGCTALIQHGTDTVQ
ncbi:hypothetical protein C9J85_06030 [Haloferax sp. wsp5]|nr:hypothetical protein C9J85_06030 [Haloferax sp. wsp5]